VLVEAHSAGVRKHIHESAPYYGGHGCLQARRLAATARIQPALHKQRTKRALVAHPARSSGTAGECRRLLTGEIGTE